jgi:hypothetical protein
VPIKPENKKRYPKDWKQTSHIIRSWRAGNRCEHVIDGERCTAINGQPHPITGSKVVLTVAHLNHRPEDCDPANLLAMCQRCHNRYDAEHRKRNAHRTRREKQAIGDLFT